LKTIVVDASVAIKWFLPEIHAADAERLLGKGLKLIVPDLFYAEVGSILWKKQRRKEISIDMAGEILADFKRLPLYGHSIETLITAALEIATAYQCTVYDSLYVALAHAEKGLLATADRALYNTLKDTPFAKSLLWIEDVKEVL
jgi:predicted nucleic acid-binding protein